MGVLGIGLGLWWADAIAALLISGSIFKDGIHNLRGAISGLVDTRAWTYDGAEPHPLGGQIDDYLRTLDWVAQAQSRIRDEGHVFHIKSFVVPRRWRRLSLDRLENARQVCIALDWKVQDMVIVPVAELPEEFLPSPSGSARTQASRSSAPGTRE